MRKFFVAASAALLVSCGQQGSQETTTSTESLTAVSPGVAWAFTYDYLLGNDRIEAVQERHAARCEQLGTGRCRITGLRYSVGENDEISGMLQLRLDPAIARQFGKAALEDVRGADGRLVRSEFTGEDVGTGVAEARTAGQDMSEREAELRRRLEAAPADSPERAELLRQLDALLADATRNRNTVRSGEQRLSFTPVTFNYYGEGGIPGFQENPLRESLKLLVSSFVTMISFALKAIALLLPWLLLLGLLALLWRSRPLRAVRAWWGRKTEVAGYRAEEPAA
ncbi:DUF4349 domain-containing protein [Sphingomonas sp. LHG3406-1]|uniref:DUF4349 domain-containing protein n=1 Tax=Sphingomonas sp. LHG3406-1 TaxID=2804617 RepID=UPI0026164681|nr:DUF4349 domain-containing protein [Sphingomonas sp. LHG3406-1]